MDEEEILSSQSMNQLIFPYHTFDKTCQRDVSTRLVSISETFQRSRTLFPSLKMFTLSIFHKVHAAETEELLPAKDANDEEEQQIKYSRSLEALAKAYIQRESGWDRVKTLFEKDHRGKQHLELNYIQVAVLQVFVLTFFCKYFPVAKFARKEFIRENQGSVFRTRFEAIRRMQDYTFMKAGREAAAFSTKITVFSGSFLFLSTLISSYRNKTSVLEYMLAAGITGGLARLNMGLKGFIAGSLVGGVLGSAVGVLGYFSLSSYGFTQEERHLEDIKAKLEVFKSIEGESSFQARVNQIMAEDKTLAAHTS